MSSPQSVLDGLRRAIAKPSLTAARELETALRECHFDSRILGRLNQKSSIEAAAESDRGITERLANSFDASLTAARRLAGLEKSDAALTPRVAAKCFLNSKTDDCLWESQHDAITFAKPSVQFWSDDNSQGLRFRKYQSPGGLITALVQDSSLGIEREQMAHTVRASCN